MCNLRPFILPGLLLLACSVIAQSPGGIPHQSVWVQGSVSPEPLLPQTLNFHPGISPVDGKTGMQLPRNVQSLRRVTIFTVYQSPKTSDEAPVWEMSGGFGDLVLSTRQVSSQSANTSLLFVKNQTQRTEALIHTFSGNIQRLSTTETEQSNNILRFGKQVDVVSSSPMISEFILYEKILKETEIVKIETYLALKYGITLQRDYINSSNDVVWNYKIDSAWSNNIAGIGRDDRAALNQKQGTSSNVPGQLVLGIGNIETLNNKNTGQLDDKNYLIWGDNAGSLTFKEDPSVCDGQMLLPARKWLMKRTGNNAHTIETELQIDAASILGEGFQKKDFYLVIDRTGTGQFTNENCIYLKPTNISTAGIASFKGLHWDTDGSGKDVFTFGIKPVVALVKDVPKLVSFQVYPNPVTGGNYRMSLTLDKVSDIEVRVYDMHQRLVQSRKGTGQLSYLFPGTITGAAGPYTIKVITPQAEYSRIIIVQ